MAFKKDTKVKNNFTKITIGLASPEEILENSYGEVTKPETINYRTYKPERDGLFCERIFGPTKDYECACGKYKRIRYKGIVCDRCGVEVTEKKVRRERSGHIELVVPVAHIWYFRSLPNKIGYLLGMPTKKLDAVIYYEKYVVIQPGILEGKTDADGLELNGSHKLDLLSEDEYMALLDQYDPNGDNELLDDTDPNKFIAKMGAEAIYQLLQNVDLDSLSYELRDRANNDSSQQRKTEALKRLQVVEGFRASKGINKPEWMIMKIIPVTPPELRPLVPLDGGRFATSDLNDLYRRVIIRNNRLKRLVEIKAPEVILRNEKRMLQEAVDSLFDNSRKSSAVKSESNRPLKSLSDSLKGKQGRFRQNLLGKRVDYSARSVIVVGPELKMGECGLPKLMAAELYKPFIIRKLIERGIVKTVKSAKKIVDRREPVIWDILENVMKGHPVMLNRAPTLHRLGIQAFQPKMIEGKAIQLHPLACTAFNADFDGDQMAVHLPLSNEAVLEAQILMLQSHNILNPANGAPITVPSQDMVLGLYYITKIRPGAKGEGLTFYGPEEALIARNEGRCDLHALIKVVVDDLVDGTIQKRMVETSVGRVIVNGIIPDEVGFFNDVISKKTLRGLISNVIKAVGMAKACEFLDGIKNLGYRMAYVAGLSFNLGDIIIPPEKEAIVERGRKEVEEITNNYNMGFITNKERYNQVIDAWTHVNTDLGNILMKEMTEADQGFNAVYMMLDSGARGSKDQIKQLSGMRLDRPLFKKYYKELASLCEELDIEKQNLMQAIVRMPNVVTANDGTVDDAEWTLVKATIQEALDALSKYRSDEGASLYSEFKKRTEIILELLGSVDGFEAERIARMREKLLTLLDDNLPSDKIDKNRFEQELIFYIEKFDITEEKLRLKLNCNYFLDELCNTEKVKGRKLNFICQEIGREINTLGSKANHHDLQKIVVQMKDELEKIKEQLANVV